MSNKRFIIVVAIVLVAGLSYGGVFGAGTIFGRSTAPEPAADSQQIVALPTSAAGTGPTSLALTPEELADMRARIAENLGGQPPRGRLRH